MITSLLIDDKSITGEKSFLGREESINQCLVSEVSVIAIAITLLKVGKHVAIPNS